MCERFYKLRRKVKMACISAELEFPLSDDDLNRVHELCEALTPVQFAITMLSKKLGRFTLRGSNVAICNSRVE